MTDRAADGDPAAGPARLERILRAIRERHDPAYEFLSPGPLPWSLLDRPLDETRVLLVTTGGLHLKSDPPFEPDREPGGDTSFRWVPHGARARELERAAPYVDAAHAAKDPEVALPMRALERLHREGVAGRPVSRHAVFCGGILRPLPGLERSVERLLPELRDQGAGAAVLLPTCSLCVQTVSLLARALESSGLATVTISMLPELTERVGAPRTLAVRFPFGAPCGDPGNRELHLAVLREALELLATAERAGEIRRSGLGWRKAPRRAR